MIFEKSSEIVCFPEANFIHFGETPFFLVALSQNDAIIGEKQRGERAMKEKLIAFVKEHIDVVTYLVFGVLTTVVNYLVYLPCLNWLHLPASVSNCIAWVVAVVFAFVTNKPFVFQSHDWSMEVVLPELSKFVATRLTSGLLETAILFISVDLLHGNGNIWKLITQVLVIIINYVGSKLLVFRKK